jgi:hypothetical protein
MVGAVIPQCWLAYSSTKALAGETLNLEFLVLCFGSVNLLALVIIECVHLWSGGSI